MFDLRNMPFVSGRVLSWSDDLKPVATAELKEFVEVENGKSKEIYGENNVSVF